MAVLLLGVAAALLVILSEVTNLVVVDVTGAGCEDAVADPELADGCEITGGEQHSFALVPLALLIGVMAVGAGLGGSRPAAVALVVVGVLVLGWSLLVDLPVTDETGAIGRNFEGATASAGAGLTLEIVAGVLLVAAGLARLLAPASAGAPSADRAGEQDA